MKFSFLHKISVGLALLLFLAFLSRVPTLLEPYRYGDEGIYLTLGLALRRGLVWYKDIHDNKPPMLYLLAAAGGQFWFRFILLWWNLANVYLIYFFGKKIFKKESAGLLAGFIFLLFTIFNEGNIPNSEIFMVLPTTGAMLIIAQSSRLKAQGYKLNTKYFFAGLLFGASFLFKVPAGFSFAAAVCFLAFFSRPKKIINLKSDILYLITGFLILPLASIIYYWLKGAGSQYLKAAFFQNIGYLSSWSGEWNRPLFSLSSAFMQRSLILAGLLLGLFLIKSKLSKSFLLVILWFLLDLYGSLLSGRPYPHYLIQTAPALSLLAPFVFFSKKLLQKLVVVFAVAFLVFSFLYYRFWRYPVVSYYLNFSQFVLGFKSKDEYFSYFGGHVPYLYRTAKFIKMNTKAEDYIFIWGNEPSLYALADRLPPGRYVADYHIIDFDGYQETINSILEKSPSLIINFGPSELFPGLGTIIAADYRQVEKIGPAIIYKRINDVK